MKPIATLKAAAWTFALLLTAAGAQAETVDINIGDKNARAALQGPLKRVLDGAQGHYDLGILTSREQQGRLTQGHVGLLLSGDVGVKATSVQAGLGGRLVVASAGNGFSGSALALGGQIEARMPQMNRLGVTAQVYLAPNATSFSNLDRYREMAVALDYQVIRQASAYVGYRNVNYKAGGTSRSVDNGLHLGFRLNF